MTNGNIYSATIYRKGLHPVAPKVTVKTKVKTLLNFRKKCLSNAIVTLRAMTFSGFEPLPVKLTTLLKCYIM